MKFEELTIMLANVANVVYDDDDFNDNNSTRNTWMDGILLIIMSIFNLNVTILKSWWIKSDLPDCD